MKKLLVALLLLGVGALGVQAEDFKPHWLLEFSGNLDTFGLSALYAPAERVRIGPEFTYDDGVNPEQTEAYGVRAVGQYYGLYGVPMQLWTFEVPTDWFVGVGIGAQWAGSWKADNVADLRTGFEFGAGPVKLGVLYRYNLPEWAWEGLENAEHQVLVTLSYALSGK